MTKSKKQSRRRPQTQRSKPALTLKEQLKITIDAANNHTDPLESIPPNFLTVDLSPASASSSFTNATANDILNADSTTSSSSPSSSLPTPSLLSTVNTKQATTAKIKFVSSPLNENVLHQCLSLFETNMAHYYKQSSWGLDMDDKRKELMHADARFLMVLSDNHETVTNGNGDDNNDNSSAGKDDDCQVQVLGFLHYRHEFHNDDPDIGPAITYLYELQISPTLQNCGLGKRLMTTLELLSLHCHMHKIVLTVFKTNLGAMNFYLKKMKGWGVDESSPSNYGGYENNEGCDYEILSKALIIGGAGGAAKRNNQIIEKA